MPTKKLVIPKFSTEQAEAEWFDKNKRTIEADMLRRLRAGEGMTLAQALKLATGTRRTALKPVTIRIPSDDLAAARRLAERRGLPYQTYIKMLLRDGLRRDLTAQEKARR